MVKHSKCKRGGSHYSSATTYGSYVNGGTNDQFARTFDLSGPNANNQSNILIGAQGENATQIGTPTANQLSTIQSAGRKHRKHKKRGGFLGLGQVVNQAIVPFSLLGLQNSYSNKHRKHGGKTRKHKKSRKNRKSSKNRY